MLSLFIDIETYCELDLRNVGVYRYVEHPSFEILMAAWSLDGIDVNIWTEDFHKIPGLFDPDITKVAHNAAFERICFNRLAGLPVGEYLSPEQYHCTQAVAGERGYPQKLSALAKALGAPPKDEAGTRLINLFSLPNRRTGKRTLPADKPADWERFKNYCVQDVVTLIEVDTHLGDFPTEDERKLYYEDQRINDRGIRIDLELATAAEVAAHANTLEQEEELATITGIDNPGSPIQLMDWARSVKMSIPNLKAESVEKALAKSDLPPTHRRVLELRQDLALTASSKYATARRRVNSDERLRGGFHFFGAHTGRWAGRGVQLHNLPRASLESDLAVRLAILDLKLGLGADAHTLKALIRPMFIGPLTVADYSAIEARVISWIAGERWALDAFVAGRDIYVETAERMGGLTRYQGKVAVLALGYNGGINSLRAMGAQGEDNELDYMVKQWRRANPAIVDLWQELDRAFLVGGKVGQGVVVIEKDGRDRHIRLPSGRSIVYHDVRVGTTQTKYGPKKRMTFLDPRRPGLRIDTYGGRLAENVTQAIARDVLAASMGPLREAGYDVVSHVHDEIIIDGEQDLKDVIRIMTTQPWWAEGLPLNAEGFVCDRYRKG